MRGVNAILYELSRYFDLFAGGFSSRSGYAPTARRFSLPPIRYFHRHNLEPLGITSKYKPPPAAILYGFTAGLAEHNAASLIPPLGGIAFDAGGGNRLSPLLARVLLGLGSIIFSA